MALALPKFIAIKSVLSGHYASVNINMLCCQEKEVFSPRAKIEVERAKIDNKFVHLRFCCCNKYWGGDGRGNVVLFSRPEEDTSKTDCTMFEPTISNDFLYLRHVHSGRHVRTNDKAKDYLVSLEDKGIGDSDKSCRFKYVDWDTLVIMPRHVAFKGYNDKYLRSAWWEGHEYLDFSCPDCRRETTAYEVTMNPDGYLRIKSKFFGKFWRRSPNWIWGDSTDADGNDIDTLFWPIKVSDSIIALRNAGNNRFCSSLTTEGKTDCLNAAVPTITTEARLLVEELVFGREIIDVIYRMNDAQIFNERPFVAGSGTATNNTQEAATLTIRVSHEDNSSYSFSNSSSIMTGVKTTIQTGFPRIVEGKIEISAEVTNSFEWNRTTSETKTAEATYEAVVPPMSTIKVDYIATQGTCNIPFSYTQHDKLSLDGSFLNTQHIDGVYTGVNNYGFHFEQNVVQLGTKIDRNTIE